MSIDFDGLKGRLDIVEVIGSYVSLRKRGAEFVGVCPFHPDKNPSMYVVPAKRIYHCFSCGASGDVVDFVANHQGVDVKEAAKILGAPDVQWKPKTAIPHEKVPQKPERITSKPPASAGEPHMAMRDLGAPSRVWTYRDADGAPLMYVARYETPDGKQIRCWTWGKRGDEPAAWGCGHWNRGERPLYGLDRLAARSGALVLMVEGEKAADAAQALLPQYVVMTWPGGSHGLKHADLSPLKGKRVDLWPDADDAGRDAMRRLADLLSDQNGLACHGKVIDPRGMPEGGDAADWQGEDVMAWLRERATPYPEPKKEPARPPEPPPDELPPVEAYEEEGNVVALRRPLPKQAEGDAPAAMSEDFMAERFAHEHAERWRYVKPWGSWFEWRGDGWYKDETGLIDHHAVQMTRKAIYWPEAKELSADARRRVNSRRTAGAIRDLAMSDRRLAAVADQWDSDTWLLGVPGGVVNLRDGTMHKARPEDYMTKRTACAPISEAPVQWLEFLKRVTDGDDQLIAYLQRFAGYSLTGETSEHALVFFYGTGANGKSTFLQTLSGLWQDYAVSAGFEVFAEAKGDRHPTEIARLRGARLVITEETDAGGRWNEGRIKRLTGGGKISAHFMRQDDFEFEPHFKLMIAGNHKPMIKAVDEAIKRRIHVVPFTVTIPPEERDKALVRKLEAEWPQILNWAIQGALAWQERSLSPVDSVVAATEQYVESEDVLGAWLDECCEREPASSADGKVLYESYRKWCEAQGENAWSRRGWSSAMLDRGFTQKRTKDARRFAGLELKLGQSAGPSWQP